jgi:hypothetical protein
MDQTPRRAALAPLAALVIAGRQPAPREKEKAMTDAPPKSTFVTALAWVFIVLSAGATAISALQNVMVYFLFPRAEMKAAMESGPASAQMPGLAKFMFANVELFFAAFFCLSLLMLMSAIGLLNRKNWARRASIGLMAFGIAWNLGGLVLQQVFMSELAQPTNAPAEFQSQFQTMQTVMRIVAAVFSVGFSALFGWIIWRLRSAKIVAEFQAPSAERAAG